MYPHAKVVIAKTTTMLKLTRLAIPAVAVALVGCAEATPPNELVYARAGVSRAKSGPAMQFDPADVHESEVALQRAEAAFDDDPDAPETRDLARIAQLKAAKAEASAGAIMATQRKEQAQRDITAAQAERIRAAEGALNQTQGQLAAQSQETMEERQKRMEAEARLRDALSKVAEVKEEDRGTVITIPGDVLFKTAKWTIMPGARAKLDKVAASLKTSDDRHIVVVGHTDSQGGNSKFNQDLSDKRADAVRGYLVSKGIPSDMITTEGRGPSEPIADNASVEGRAQNRRVEIVVEHPENKGSKGTK